MYVSAARRLRDDFAALVAAGERTDLGRAALAIARIAYPTLEPAPHLAELDALAEGARERVVAARVPEGAAVALAGYLFGECGFRGNQQDYYDPRNSFLNDVLERRTGLPITLALVFMEAGARLGLSITGVGFPGHFLVRVESDAGSVVLDPFFGGRLLDVGELLARYRAFLGPRGDGVTSLPPDVLAVTDAPAILARMLRNLLHVYLDRRDHAHALEAVDLLLVLTPDAPEDVRLRGLLYERLECFGAALADLRRYLELAPGAPDAQAIDARAARLAHAAAAVH